MVGTNVCFRAATFLTLGLFANVIQTLQPFSVVLLSARQLITDSLVSTAIIMLFTH